jgi:hypothetical protein
MSDFGAGATVGGGYEFNADEEQIIGRTARYAWLWGIVSIVIGTFALLSSLQGSAAVLGQIPMGIANIVIGSFFVGTSRSLKAVVTTTGDDIAHLPDPAHHVLPGVRRGPDHRERGGGAGVGGLRARSAAELRRREP